ncbi:MAG TPA: MFS transporter [Xanthobacteraceae bacterium]|jgi:predicted MFS family arabinose efflux permease|nr:MFS transporter [Xanthobacteraceae bacterium]
MVNPGQQEFDRERPMAPTRSPWSPFRHKVYRLLWIATVASNVGAWMYSAAASWLMTSLNPDPVMVSLVQVATSLPMFLFALPAGALADIIEKRRFIILLEVTVTAVAALFATLLSLGFVGPATLLIFTFLGATCSALEAPAWQSIVPQLVQSEDLPGAIAANSVGVNISRAVGPALAGILIASVSLTAPFWIDVFSNMGVIAVFLWWRPSPQRSSILPAERFTGAIRAGFRYVAYNQPFRATLARSVGFFLFASAYWALLPLLARNQLAGGPELYGLLLGAIGAAAVGGAFVLPRLKRTFGADGVVILGEFGTAVALILLGIAREPAVAVLACVFAGTSWIAAIANLNTSAQLSLADWVRGRGLAMYVTVFFGSMAVGSIIWGEIARTIGLAAAHFVAAAGALAAIPLTLRWKLQSGAVLDLTPSMDWPEPVIESEVQIDSGPVLVLVEYRVDAINRKPFLEALAALAQERKRDGSYDWGVFEDTAENGRFLETFLVESWLEHLRQHERVTKADQVIANKVHHLLRSPPVVTHLINAEPQQVS